MGVRAVLLVFFVIMCSSLAFGLAETQIQYLDAECNVEGDLIAHFRQYEKPIDISKINITAVHKKTGEEINLKGDWFINNEKVRFLTGGIEFPAEARFVSANNELTKDGEYIIQLEYYVSVSESSLSRLKFAVECLGLECNSDHACKEDEFCNDGNCNYLKCDSCEIMQFHRCDPKCEDNNPCTRDMCNAGVCVNKYVGGICCRSHSDCDDKKVCTIDYCKDTKCYNDPVVCKKADDKCVFAECIEPDGCVYQTDESCLEKVNEQRKYLITVGEPEVVKEPFITRIATWISDILGNFF